MKAVERDGYALRYVNDQTPDLCLKAVEQNGYAFRQRQGSDCPDLCPKDLSRVTAMPLRYVNDQTPDICLKAVEQNGYALRYVGDQTPDPS